MSESAANNIIALYEKNAESWDRMRRDYLYEQRWLDRFLALIPLNGRILDIGCGSGRPVADYFINRHYRLTGIDSSSAMLSLCRARYPEQQWYQADMRQLALDMTFDGLIAWDSFFHLTADDQRAMFGIFKQHARPGAALMFTSGPKEGEAIGIFEGEPLYHASLSPEEYRMLLESHGFSIVKMKAEDPDCGQHTIWLAQWV